MSEKKKSFVEKLKKWGDRYLDKVVNITHAIEEYTFIDEVSGGSVIPPWLRHRIADNDEKEIVKKPEEKKEPPIKPNIVQENNKVYKEPQIIYRTDITNIVNIQPQLPQLPRSVLEVERGEESLRQTPTKVNIGSPISLAQSIKDQSFGQMLYNPFSNKEQTIRQANSSNAAETLKELNDEGIERFAAYLAEEEETSILDAIVLFSPANLRGSSGGFGMLVGKDTIEYRFANLTASSSNALIGVSDTIPNGYTIEKYDPDREIVEATDIDLELKPSGSIDLGKILEEPINFEEWIQEAVDLQYGEEEDERNEVETEDFAEFVRNVIAPFYFRLGLNKLPITLPKNLVVEGVEEEEENQVETRQLSEFFLWQLQAFDSVLGQFPIKIKIDDTDLIKTGDQSLSLNFPNLAETISELIGYALINKSNNDALLEIVLKTLVETGQIKQQSIQNYYLSAAIQEYLGFETKQKNKEVDFPFNPRVLEEDEENRTLAKILESSNLKVPIESNSDDNTLEKHLYSLVEAARIIKAVHFRGIDLKENPGEQIANLIKKSAAIADGLDFNQEEDLEDFLENVEQGFANKFTGKDITTPYNRPFSERPKVKQNIKDADENIT